jgi:hypothetical protein
MHGILAVDMLSTCNLHRHESVGLGLDLGHARDGLDLRKELLLGREFGRLPCAKGIDVERRHNLEVQAPAAHDALHAFHTLHALDLAGVRVRGTPGGTRGQEGGGSEEG